MANYSYLLKFIVVGDSGVGKSCFVIRFVDNRFKTEHDVTIGIEFGTRDIELEGKKIRIQIWDTAGQENFKSITRSYYRGAASAILMYDISNRETFRNVMSWVKEVQTHANAEIMITLVGNKSDLEAQRQVTYEEALDFAQEHDMMFFEGSAKTGFNVELAFHKNAEKIIDMVNSGIINIKNDLSGVKIGKESTLDAHEKKKKKSCKC